jgi:DNA-binding response OmpR family regulator
MKILLVEDEKILREMCAGRLKKSGFEVIEAIEGEEAVEKTRENNPELILLDIIIPKKNGYEVLDEIKSDKKTEKIPVIMLSNLGQREEIEKSKKLGADDFIIKANTEPKEIAEYVEEHFNQKT